MNNIDNNQIKVFIGSLASVSGSLLLSTEIFALQIFRSYLWHIGITDWSVSVNAAHEFMRPTAASDVISVTWVYVAFMITLLIIIIGVILVYEGLKAIKDHDSEKS